MEGGVVNDLELKPGERGEVYEILPEGEHRHAYRYAYRHTTGEEHRHAHRHTHQHRYCGHCQGKGRSRGNGEGKGSGERLLEVLGAYRGQVLEVLENRGSGPVILKVGDSRFVLGRGQAARILVNRLR